MSNFSNNLGQRLLTFGFGDVGPIIKACRFFVAVTVAAALAWPIHEGFALLLTRMSPTEVARVDRAEKMISDSLAELTQGRPFRATFGFLRPGNTVHTPGCAGQLEAQSREYLGYAVWRASQASTAGVQPRAQNTAPPSPRLAGSPTPDPPAESDRVCGEKRYIYHGGGLGAPFVTAPTIVASIDILLRDIERFVGNENPDDVANLRLCAGTRTLLGQEICSVTEQLRRCLSGDASCIASGDASIKNVIESRRWAALLLGLIQYVCLTIFIFILLQIVGFWFAFVDRKPVLIALRHDGIEPINPLVPAQVDMQGNDLIANPAFQEARASYEALRIRSNLDQIYVHTFVRESAHIPETSDVHAFRQFMIERVSAQIGQLEKLADSILKLAFAGTIIGIAQALFAARDLDTANPIERLSVKAEMFAGIGVAFGTTLFGLGLVLLLDRAMIWLKTVWEGDIARSFQLVLDFSKTASAQELATTLGRGSETIIKPILIRQNGIRGLPTLAGLIAVGLVAWALSILNLWVPILSFLRGLMKQVMS